MAKSTSCSFSTREFLVGHPAVVPTSEDGVHCGALVEDRGWCVGVGALSPPCVSWELNPGC